MIDGIHFHINIQLSLIHFMAAKAELDSFHIMAAKAVRLYRVLYPLKRLTTAWEHSPTGNERN